MRWCMGVVCLGAWLLLGCDGVARDGADDEALGVTAAPYSVKSYEPPKGLKEGEPYVAEELQFESKDDLARFSDDYRCEAEDAPDECQAVQPAYDAAEKNGRVCGIAFTSGGPRWPSGSGPQCYPIVTCSTCCTPTRSFPWVSCTTTCQSRTVCI